ncbi:MULTISPECIES: hypothetical protein [Micromonosporaceae]|uniref:helix-turn-helix transcriptional regulator n=1 Tax=Micromonosporaceae TaxID=28056 RepID=UPI0033ED3120
MQVEQIAADMRKTLAMPGSSPGVERWIALGYITGIARPASSCASAGMSDADRLAAIRAVLDALDLIDADHADNAEWTTEQVLAYLAEQNRPVNAKTWSGYVSRGQAPAPVRHISRTPVWDSATIRAWHAGRRGQAWRASPDTTETAQGPDDTR